jgi:hypothetical protein
MFARLCADLTVGGTFPAGSERWNKPRRLSRTIPGAPSTLAL